MIWIKTASVLPKNNKQAIAYSRPKGYKTYMQKQFAIAKIIQIMVLFYSCVFLSKLLKCFYTLKLRSIKQKMFGVF